MKARFDPPRWFVAVTGLFVLFAYTFHLVSSPLKGEEQRRCQVAIEMIHSGDYVVPHLQGQPYFKKPPMQNWLIVLFSGNRFERVGEFPVRLITLLSLAGIALLLGRLGTSTTGGPELLPPLVFLTFGTMLQDGWMGEVDPLFTFFVFAALATFEIGRRRGSAGIQWGISQAFVALGVLTKGFAPLFFYPPVLYLAWRRRDRDPFSTRAFAGGLLLMVAIVSAWVVPFALRAPRADSAGTWNAEIVSRIAQGVAPFVQHLFTYPLLWIGLALPWSLYLFRFVSRKRRIELRGITQDDWRALALAVVGWIALVYLVIPGVKARYLIPALPFAAVLVAWLVEQTPDSRAARSHSKPGRGWWTYCGVLGAGWIAYVMKQGFEMLDRPAAIGILALGLAAVVSVAAVRASGRLSSTVAPFLVVALLYGIGSRGILDEREARRLRGYREAASSLLTVVGDDRPVVCVPGMSRRLAFEVSRRLGRPVGERPPESGSYYRIAPAELEDPPAGTRRAESWIYAIWDVEANAESPIVPDERLLRARGLYEIRPANVDSAIRLARTYAEFGRYLPAEAVLTRMLADRPNDSSLLRWRGEARIHLDRFDEAITDLESAARESEKLPVTVETPQAVFPDDRPKSSLARRIERILDAFGNSSSDAEREKLTGPTQIFNSLRLLAMARFLEGDFVGANADFGRSIEFATTPETICTSSYWKFLALSRLARDADARALAATTPDCGLLDLLAADDLPDRDPESPELEFARANRALTAGDPAAAATLFRELAERGAPTRLTTVAARAELSRSPTPAE